MKATNGQETSVNSLSSSISPTMVSPQREQQPQQQDSEFTSLDLSSSTGPVSLGNYNHSPNLLLMHQNSNKPLQEIIELCIIVGSWYASSALTNNINKTILNEDVFPFPFTVTIAQFGFISFFCYAMFVMMPKSYKMQEVNANFIKSVIAPLCFSQVIAHLLTQMSLQMVPVSFTHTIKGSSPIFAIILSKYYQFHERYSMKIVAAVALIIAGVILSSFNEINFNFFGFATALGSTLVFSWQNTYSKKVFRDKSLDHVNLLFYTATCAFCMMLPVWFIMDLPRIIEFSNRSNFSLLGLSYYFMLDGICHFGQNITAFTFMSRVTPLTYTVFNTFKRTFVIISSILYFGNPVLFLNGLGIALTTVGVGLYNKAKLDKVKGEFVHK